MYGGVTAFDDLVRLAINTSSAQGEIDSSERLEYAFISFLVFIRCALGCVPKSLMYRRLFRCYNDPMTWFCATDALSCIDCSGKDLVIKSLSSFLHQPPSR